MQMYHELKLLGFAVLIGLIQLVWAAIDAQTSWMRPIRTAKPSSFSSGYICISWRSGSSAPRG